MGNSERDRSRFVAFARSLTARQAEALHRRHAEGQSRRETADTMECSPSNVDNLERAARKEITKAHQLVQLAREMDESFLEERAIGTCTACNTASENLVPEGDREDHPRVLCRDCAQESGVIEWPTEWPAAISETEDHVTVHVIGTDLACHSLPFSKKSQVMGHETPSQLELVYVSHGCIIGHDIDEEGNRTEGCLWEGGQPYNDYTEWDPLDTEPWDGPEEKADYVLWRREG